MNGGLVRLLALAVPAEYEGVAVGTELAYLSCQPGGEAVVYF